MRHKIAALAGLLLCSCTGAPPATMPHPVMPPESVLIVTESSEFKQAVVAKVTAALTASGRSFRVADLKALDEARSQEHQAVVILNEIWAGRLSGKVRHFLQRIAPALRGKIILVSTAGQASWQAQEEGIDAITSASTVADQQRIADFILGKIEALLAFTATVTQS